MDANDSRPERPSLRVHSHCALETANADDKGISAKFQKEVSSKLC